MGTPGVKNPYFDQKHDLKYWYYVKILPVWAIRIHTLTTKIYLGKQWCYIFTNKGQKIGGTLYMGTPGGQKSKFWQKKTPNIDNMIKSSQFGPLDNTK